MRVTTIGHAGLLIEVAGRRILCDPWFNPAYLGSWFPFPRNDHLDAAELGAVDYLYVSHLHRDHFDPAFLSTYVNKNATVILPDYPLNLLERALQDLGFHRFLRTTNGVPCELEGFRVLVVALGAPTDGPIGDSALVVSDGEVTVCNLNDARPTDVDPILAAGRLDALFLQTSGAIWYPMVYDFPPEKMAAAGRAKRAAGMARAWRLIELLRPAHVVPFAGPPAFLDEELFSFNDLRRDPTNTFPDQTVFLEYLADQPGAPAGHLMVPGSSAEIGPDGFALAHLLDERSLSRIFTDKATYLRRYQDDWAQVLEAERASWAVPGLDIAGELAAWITPLLERAERLCAEVGGSILVEFGEVGVLFDFRARRVGPWRGEPWDHRFHFSRAIGEHLVATRCPDWVNEAFLSCRFRASRRVPHNDAVFTFFKCLTEERIDFAEAWLARQADHEEEAHLGGWCVQRRCPHAKADLARFGVVADGILTCHLHGYRYDLETGECLTNPRLHIEAHRLEGRNPPEADPGGRAEGDGLPSGGVAEAVTG